MTDSFENLMNSRFDQIANEEKRVNEPKAIQEKQEVLPALQNKLSIRFTNALHLK